MDKQKRIIELSVRFVYILLFAVLSIIVFSYFNDDSDYYWHYKLGEYIFQNHRMMTTDIFSWLGIERQAMTMNHSWLSSVLLYLSSCIYLANPLFGRFIWIFVTAFSFYFILQCTFMNEVFRKKEIHCFDIEYHIVQLICLIVLFCFRLFEYARPACLGYSLFILSIYLMYQMAEEPNTKYYLYFGLISVLWANIHGGTLPMLFAFLGLFLVLSIIPNFELGRVKHTQKIGATKYYSISLLISMCFGLLNPYGYSLYTYFFLQNDAATKAQISEWQPAKFSSPGILVILFLFFVMFLFVKAQISIDRILPICICFLLCAKYCRMEFYSIALAVPLVCYIYELLEIKCPFNQDKFRYFIKLYTVALGSAAIIGCVVALYVQRTEMGIRLPSNIVSYLKTMQFERMYSDYNLGGLLIYEDIPSFIDSRADLFDGKELNDSLDFYDGNSHTLFWVDEYLANYNFDAILLTNDSLTIGELLILRGWVGIYVDENFIVLVPSDSPYLNK